MIICGPGEGSTETGSASCDEICRQQVIPGKHSHACRVRSYNAVRVWLGLEPVEIL